MARRLKKIAAFLQATIARGIHFWRGAWWHKAIAIVIAAIIILFGAMFGIAKWYVWSERNQPLVLGASFVPDYASYLGVDPHATFTAMLDDLHIRHFRLVSYWSDIERSRGTDDFSELDWEFSQAAARGAKITLAIGLRQPRWPECHMPDWATSEPKSVWQPQLEQFMTTVIDRYKGNPALESYQLENEYFLTAFATCADESRSRLVEEAALVRKLDPSHTLIISRSQNAVGWPVGQPHADEYGISIYRRVWTPLFGGRYIDYPFPAWYYSFLAGAEKLWSGKDTIIHELQAEPWTPHGAPINATSLAEQNKSFNADRLKGMVDFGKATGMRSMDLWGAEYWYYRMVKLHDTSVWNAARQEFADNAGH